MKGHPRHLSSEGQLLLFRMAQEALNNVRRHSGASAVDVLLEFSQNKTTITVDDNGRGFKPPGRFGDLVRESKLGLLGMQERARLVGGSISIWSEPDKGARVVVEIPF